MATSFTKAIRHLILSKPLFAAHTIPAASAVIPAKAGIHVLKKAFQIDIKYPSVINTYVVFPYHLAQTSYRNWCSKTYTLLLIFITKLN